MNRSLGFCVAVGLAAATLLLSVSISLHQGHSQAQELKRFQYKVVEVPADTFAMQQTLNEYGAAGWELVAVGMGEMTNPRLVFKK